MANDKKDPRKARSRLSSILGALAGSFVLLFSPFASKSASTTDSFVGNEETEWERVSALGSADAIQEFIERFPNSPRVAEAFDLMVASEVAASEAVSAPMPVPRSRHFSCPFMSMHLSTDSSKP